VDNGVATTATEKLRKAIIATLRQQGYVVRDGAISFPSENGKDEYRRLQGLAVAKKRASAVPELRKREDRLLQFIADGKEVVPSAVSPRLVPVKRRSEHELLFRYLTLHWSVPVSAGYGRRLRFLIFDDSNGKVIGLLGLGDPVYAMQARDHWIGWNPAAKKANLYHVLDAYALGAVPPYARLLGGKLVALLALSNEVRQAFRAKYGGRRSLIAGASRPPYLALLTTTSALGRSSLYNRIRINGFPFWTSVGYTQGSGEFHFSNGVYADIRSFVCEHCTPTAKDPSWGTGFRNKREVVRKCLSALGLSADLIYHGVRREIFLAPLGRQALPFLCDEASRPCFYDWSAHRLAETFKERWLIPRAERAPDYLQFRREQYRLWSETSRGPGKEQGYGSVGQTVRRPSRCPRRGGAHAD
jgi:hypothetical protein